MSPHLASGTISGTHEPSELTHNGAGEYLLARYATRSVRELVRETIDLPSKPSREARRYTENILVEDRTQTLTVEILGEGIISVIISVDADSEKMEPRCQQLEDTTPGLIDRPLHLTPRGQYRPRELAFVATIEQPIFFEKRLRTKNDKLVRQRQMSVTIP
jgi:hypothetical protein